MRKNLLVLGLAFVFGVMFLAQSVSASNITTGYFVNTYDGSYSSVPNVTISSGGSMPPMSVRVGANGTFNPIIHLKVTNCPAGSTCKFTTYPPAAPEIAFSATSSDYGARYSVAFTISPLPAPGSYNFGVELSVCDNGAVGGVCIGGTQSGTTPINLPITVTSPAVNGVCAAAHYNCSAGTSTGTTGDTSAVWNWNCNGSGGGSNATCSENKPAVAGVCAATHYNCTTGASASNVSGATTWTWSCTGINGGATPSCTENKPLMTGTLTPVTPTSCTIPLGGTTCNINFSWTTTNPVATSSVTSPYPVANTVVGNGNSGGPTAFTVPYASSPRTFYLYNNATILAQTTATSVCSAGTAWNGSQCASVVNGVLGTANGKTYSSGSTVYAPDTQCASGTSTNLAFPAAGGSTTWVCNGSNGGTNSGTGSASRSAVPVMSGTLTPATGSCTIALNASTCNINYSWTTTNPVATSAVTSPYPVAGTTVANGNNGGPTAFSIPWGGRTFYLYNNAVLLAQSTVAAGGVTCVAGSGWDGTKCTSSVNGGWSAWAPAQNPTCGFTGSQSRTCTNPAPSLGGLLCTDPSNPGYDGGNSSRNYTNPPCAATTLNATSTTIYTGSSTTLSWSGSGTCTGANFNTGGASSGSTSVSPASTTTYIVTCDGGSASKTITVKKKPTFIEN